MMSDRAHDWTEEQIAALEGRIRAVYSEALEEMSRKEFGSLEEYAKQLARKKKALEKGRITQAQFDIWMRQQAAELTRAQGMVDEMAKIANAANVAAAQMAADDVPRVFAENANWAAFYVDQSLGKVTGFDIVNRDAVRRLVVEEPNLVPDVLVDSIKDLTWNRQKFASAIVQSVLQGESVEHTVERLGRVMGMNERHATMLARTALTSAENGGRQHTYDRARRNGVELKEVWVATLDGRTRDSHRMLDGQTRDEATGRFENGLRFPGDPSGRPEEVANCRCALEATVKGFSRDFGDMSSRWSRLPRGATYEEWKAGKYSGWEEKERRAAERAANNG